MLSGPWCSNLLLSLPDDIFVLLTRILSVKDVCNISLCCRGLYALTASDKVWFTQCEMLGFIPTRDLIEWRKGVSSCKALCRFLFIVQPLFGVWVHQNPELGNVVYVMPGFVSVVGCRIIPQELGPLGLEEGPILWAPVFEILCDSDGSALFLLHGREKENDYFYPGSIKEIDRTCNVLLLEVEPTQRRNAGKLVNSESFGHHLDQELARKISEVDSRISKSESIVGQNASTVSFSRLAFGDRRKLLDIVFSQVRQKVPDSMNGLLFPRLRVDGDIFCEDMVFLHDRRSLLLQMYKLNGEGADQKAGPELCPCPSQLELSEIRRELDHLCGVHSSLNGHDGQPKYTKRRSLAGYFRDRLKQILGKSTSINRNSEILGNCTSSYGGKRAQLHEFLHSGDTIGLTLCASTMKLSSYRAWPTMHDSRFALYKLPLSTPVAGQEYAGLWGGTFGWPPGKCTKEKPGKALFFLLLSYEESEGHRQLIATKILEGTHFVLHPNGSAMFMANMDEQSLDPFPWNSDGDTNPIDVKHAFIGDGIANGYGFRYPGSKPGSLFVIHDGLLAFIWQESRAVLTLQRIDLQELLKKGERVPALPPIANFSYLTSSYSNVFTDFSEMPILCSPRLS